MIIVIVTRHIVTKEGYKRFWRDDIIPYIDLKANIYWILLRIYFSFIILMMTMKRHMTLWSHDMSHDVMP